MKQVLPFLLASLVTGFATSTEAQSSGVVWSLEVYDILGEHDYIVAPDGGQIMGTGIQPCVQSPIRLFRNRVGQLQEEVRVTCNVGISSHVTLIQTCWESKPDSSYGAMKVDDGIENYTIALSCKR